MKIRVSAAIVLAVALVAPAGFAQSPQPTPSTHQSRHELHQMMMQRRTEACSGKKQGDDCSFQRPNGRNTKGTCQPGPGGALMCRPGKRKGAGAAGGTP